MSGDAPVTVVIPCFNHGRFLADCIGSLERQRHSRWRAIVIDDASTDGETPALADAVRSDRVEVVHLAENMGRAGARNVGIERAESEAVMSLDADDKLEPDHLARTVPLLLADPRCGIVYTDYVYFGGRQGTARGKPFDRDLLYVDQYIFAGSLFRKSAFAKTPGYRSEFNIGNEDWDFWLSIIEAGFTASYVAEPLYAYRIHEGSWTSQPTLERAEKTRLSRELLRDMHLEGYRRSGKLGQFDRDTELRDGRLRLMGGDIHGARKSLFRALRLAPLSLEPWPLLLRALVARPARTAGESR
ncbi:glycosyltransferase family A protein [Polyangium sp. 15x6]|uniref:glycosyltransferase family 2 protein n=1 Tax=Polyangium sp. 15x6 TaxID=3042687 RepID=UPI00249B2CAA|nr:glycosyltransferase family A protein [Polyangium sp. 15x6]MDI3286252.1 glycosyltransferase family A protein [Polyangium sp. 15x6]